MAINITDILSEVNLNWVFYLAMLLTFALYSINSPVWETGMNPYSFCFLPIFGILITVIGKFRGFATIGLLQGILYCAFVFVIFSIIFSVMKLIDSNKDTSKGEND